VCPTSLTVVIASYKNEATIVRALQSLEDSWLQNSPPRDELISFDAVIVLDGPQPETQRILAEFRHSFPLQVIELKERAGIATARNAGVNASAAEWISFLDGDDEFCSSRLESLNSPAPDSVYIGKQKIVWDVAEAEVPGDRPFIDNGEFHLSSMLITRNNFWKLGGLNSEFSLGDDWDFLIRAKEEGLVINKVDTHFVVRHVSKNNASRNNRSLTKDYVNAVRHHIARSK
jgi:glycosyltransferase involved in cell wall biosynthesis